MRGFDINWSSLGGNPLLSHPLYQKYYLQTMGTIDINAVQQDLSGCIPDIDGAPIISYLSWLVRCQQLLNVIP